MRKYILLAFSVLLTTFVSAQTVVFHENFEAPSYGDSLVSAADSVGLGTTFRPWATSTNLFKSGLRSDTNTLQTGKTIYLTTKKFSTVNNSYIILQFSQICKLHLYDGGIVQISKDSVTWTTLTSSLYQGTGSMIQNKFCENSYTDWGTDSTTKPTNSWWKDEKFDISSLVSNSSTVYVRFKYTSSGQAIAAGRYGWLIDDVKVTISPCLLAAPTITIISNVTGTISASTAPSYYTISAYIKDIYNTNIDSAYIQYQVNNGTFSTVFMTKTNDTTFTGNIPFPGWGKTVNYNITGVDSSCAYTYAYSPSSGYYTFNTVYTGSSLTYDVGMTQITSPIGGVVIGLPVPVLATLKNYGTTTITSATIYTSLNGVLQTPFVWSGSLAQNATSSTTVCTFNSLTAGIYNLKVWSGSPNNNPDEYSVNDTAYMTFNACNSVLSGTYTIGPSGNYTTFNNALTGLLNCGINGPVVFNVAAGTYNEQIDIPYIPGTSSTNTITFQGTTSDSTLYMLKYGATSAASNYVVRFNNAQYVTFKSLTIQPTNSTYANAVVLTNGANNISLSNNLLVGTQTIFTDSNQYIVRTTSGSSYYSININNNRFNNGNLGLYIVSANSALSTNVAINYNYFYNTNGRPAQVQHLKGLQFGYNTVNISTAQTFSAGIYMDSLVGQWTFHDNYLSNLYGARIFELRNSRGAGTGNEGLVYNNFMYAGSNVAPYICDFGGGLNNIKVLFNTLVGYTTTSVYNLGNTYGTNNNMTIENNIFSGNNTSVPLIIITAAPTTYTLDYNDYYTSTNTTLGKLAGTSYTTLATWKTATGKEAHSVNVNPSIAVAGTPNALNTALVASGVAISGITTDIYGRPRATIPSVGAYEVFLIPKDAGVVDIITPGAIEIESSSLPVKVVVRNFGTDTITSMTVNYKINSGTPISFNYVGNLASLKTDTILLPNMTVPLGTTNICAYTVLAGDTNASNDQYCKSFVGNPLYDAQLKMTYALAGGCHLTTQTVKVTIKNVGNIDINGNITASYKVVGSANTVTEIVPQTILIGDTLVFPFTTPVDLSVTNTDVTYQVKTWITLQNDHIQTNDSSSTSVQSLHTPPAPIPTNITIPYATTATLTASSSTGDPIYWYQNLTGGTSFLTGTQYTTPYLYASDTFYLESSTNFILNAQIGTGTTQNTTYTYPCPFGQYFSGAREQYLIKASELTAQGVQPGQIQSCGFYVVTPSPATSAGNHLKGYTIKIGSTSQNAMTTTYVTGLTQVYYNSMYTDVTGWNMFTFSTPFVWNGTSNVVVEVCHDNYVTSMDYADNAIVNETTTSFVSTASNYTDATNQCSAAATTTFSQRPNIKFVSNIQGCTSIPRVPIIATVGSQPANDVGVTAINSPNTGTLLSNHETVTVNITNHGTAPATNFSVNFKVDNGTATTETYLLSIPKDSTRSYTFTATADLSTIGHTYKITAYTTMVGDATTINDTTIKNVTNNNIVYCTSASEYSTYDNISNVTFGGMSNPSGGSKYTDFTSVGPAQITKTIATPLSVTISGSPYSSGSTYYLRVWIDYNHDGTFDPTTEQAYATTFTRTTTSQTITGSITAPLSAIVGVTRMRIIVDYYYAPTPCWLYPTNSYYGGETEDYSVFIIPPIPNDAGITKITFPQTYIPYDPNPSFSSPRFTIKNFGTNLLTSCPVNHNFNGINTLYNWTPTFPVTSLTTSSVDSFNIPSVVVNEGLNTMIAYTSLAGDSNNFNDTCKATVFKEHLATVPYFDDFETNQYWFATDTNAGVTINNLWRQGVPASSVINSAYSPTNAWKTVLNGNTPVSNYSVLYSPLFNFAVNMGDTLKFWHWRQFASNAFGLVQYLNVFGNWVNLGAANDPNATNWYNSLNGWTGTGTGWEYSTYKVSNLSDIANYTQFRFIFNSMTATDSIHNGWAIDDIGLTLYQIAQDAGVVNITTPGSTATVGDTIAPVITVKNFGLNPITTMPVKYYINNSLIATETWTGYLTTGNTANYTFTTKYPVGPGDFTICAGTYLNGDSHYQNDSVCKLVTINPAAIDVGVTAINAPALWVGQGTPVTVAITIKNFGTIPQSSIPVYYQRGGLTPVSATWTGTPLNVGESTTYTFATTFTCPNGSSFNLCAWTGLTGDAYSPNNKTCMSTVITPVGIDEYDNNDLWLGQNVPNPANGLTTIKYNLPQAGTVDLKIINILGQDIYTKQTKDIAGKHKIEINTNEFADGVYYYSIEYNGKRIVKKMLISK